MGVPLHKYTLKPDGTTEDAWEAYVCGHCGTKVSGAVVARFHNNRTYWLMCPECEKGSVYTNGNIYPGTIFGPALQGATSRCRGVLPRSAQVHVCQRLHRC